MKPSKSKRCIYILPETHTRLKIRAATEGREIGDLAEDSVRLYLKKSRRRGKVRA